MSGVLKKDDNGYPVMGGVSSSNANVVLNSEIDPITGRLLVDNAGGGSGTVTEIDTGTGLTGGPITTNGTISLDSKLAPLDTLGSPLQSVRVNAGGTALEYYTPGSGGTPGGLNTQIQYNNAGSFGGITGAVTDGTAVSLSGAHLLSPTINGAGAGLSTLAYPNTATSVTTTIPAVTDTLVGKTTTDVLTNKDLTSGTNTFPTFNQNTTGSAATLTTGRTIAITGDLAYTSPSFNGSTNVTAAGTLATVNSNVGTFGSATQASVITVNGKGLVTAASNATVTPAVGSITGLGTGIAAFLATPSSSNLATAVTDETGSGSLVFATSPSFTTPTIGGVAIPSISSTNTFTNKRVTRRIVSTAGPGSTPSTNTDSVDIQAFTALAANITSMTTNLTGVPVAGDYLMFQFTDNGTPRTIAWGASFASTTVALPATTVTSTLLRVGFQWNGSLWQCIAVA